MWKGVDDRAEVNGFDSAWAELDDGKRAAVVALADRSSSALLSPSLQVWSSANREGVEQRLTCRCGTANVGGSC